MLKKRRKFATIFGNFLGNFYYRSSHSATAVQTETAKEPLSDAGIGGLGHLMIGEDVEVRNAEGRVDTATVRYYRPGTGYKIQFAVCRKDQFEIFFNV